MSRRLRKIAAPFVAASPAGVRVRTRLRVSGQDEVVLWAVGRHLGPLAGRDLAARCAEGRLDARGRAESRRERKRALTAESSSRWAGAITRTSEDAWQLASRNLAAERASLKARVRKVEARLAVQTGDEQGRTRGYATPAERHSKALRLKALKARLAHVERRLDAGAVPVTRGGNNLLRKRNNLAGAGLTEAQWREEWEAHRLFLTADGEAAKLWGNETIRVNPDEGWLELKLPAPLARPGEPPFRPVPASLRRRVQLPGRRGRRPGIDRGGPLRHQHRPEDRPLAHRRQLEEVPRPSGDAGGAPSRGRRRGGRQRRPSRRRRDHGRRQRRRHPVHGPARTGHAARSHPRRTAPRRGHPPHRHREGSRGAGSRD